MADLTAMANKAIPPTGTHLTRDERKQGRRREEKPGDHVGHLDLRNMVHGRQNRGRIQLMPLKHKGGGKVMPMLALDMIKDNDPLR